MESVQDPIDLDAFELERHARDALLYAGSVRSQGSGGVTAVDVLVACREMARQGLTRSVAFHTLNEILGSTGAGGGSENPWRLEEERSAFDPSFARAFEYATRAARGPVWGASW